MNYMYGSKLTLLVRGVTITAAAYNEVADKLTGQVEFQREMQGILVRHASGDWGDVDAHDAKVNRDALKSGARVLSAYTVEGIKLWVISDAAHTDNPKVREVTTILRPEDY